MPTAAAVSLGVTMGGRGSGGQGTFAPSGSVHLAEKRIHGELAEARGRGEWFRVSVAEAIRVVTNHCGPLSADHPPPNAVPSSQLGLGFDQ